MTEDSRPDTGDGQLFRVLCPSCGYAELAAGQLRLVVAGRPGGRPGRPRGGSFYSFRCPGCGQSVRRPAGERIVELLIAGGVPSVRLHTT